MAMEIKKNMNDHTERTKSNAKNKPKNTLILHAKFVNDQKSINLSPP